MKRKSYDIYCNLSEEYGNIDEETCLGYGRVGDFETLSSPLYQFQIIYDFIFKRCNLDKVITTRDKLMEAINISQPYKLAQKLCDYIRYANKEINEINVSKKTLSRYKNIILDMGYHYLYKDTEIKTHLIDLESIFFEFFCNDIAD